MEACAGSRWDRSVTGRKGKFETQNPVVRFMMDKLATATSWLNKGSRQEIKPTKSPVHPDINTGDSGIVSPRREAHESLLTHPIINNSGILSKYSYPFDTNCGAEATQILNPEGILPRECVECGAEVTQKTKRKLNPFVDGNAPAVPETIPKAFFKTIVVRQICGIKHVAPRRNL